MSVNQRIMAIAARMLAKRGNNTMPTSTTNLRNAGLTSTRWISPSAMTPENFDTIAAIEMLVSVTAKAA